MVHHNRDRDLDRAQVEINGVSFEAVPLTWQGLPINVASMMGPGQHGELHCISPSIAVCLKGHGHNDVRLGRERFRVPLERGVLAIHGGDIEISSTQWQGSADEIVTVEIPPNELSELTRGQADSLSVRTQMPFEDEALMSLIVLMRDELQRNCISGRMFAQGISIALVEYVRGRYGVAATTHHVLGKLSARDMGQVLDYMMANLAWDIGVDDLASLVGLSSSQFSRLFKATTGCSPYRYLQSKRIERAIDLFRGPDSLADIAQSVGFSSQSHFSKVFRQTTGATPAAARSNLFSRPE